MLADQVTENTQEIHDSGMHTLLSKRLEGKVAIVTGGANGIGEETVRLFVMHGSNVVIADIDDVNGTILANSLPPLATFVHCDVSSEEDVQNLFNSTISQFGKLDILFNNAGILGNQSKHKSLIDFNVDEFDRIMRVNVGGVALGMKYAARVMIPRGSGCIISTASVAGSMGGLGPHAYMASKHAIVGLTKNAACELGRYGIRVNCISPFGVVTSMLINAWTNQAEGYNDNVRDNKTRVEEMVRGLANLKGATLKAIDIAEAALYLAESKYVSGHNLVVDGGKLEKRRGASLSNDCVTFSERLCSITPDPSSPCHLARAKYTSEY
ncbi:hypothetical protein ACFE04_014574 [Oxalis oulophora]